MLRPMALTAALAVALLALSGAGGAATQQSPKRGGTVVVALVAPEPACLNPVVLARCAPGTSQIAVTASIQAVLAPPFDTGPDYSWRARLVSGVDITKKRPFTLTYHLHPDAIWSDGVPVTARDFIFTLQALRRYDPSGAREVHRSIRSIRAVDPKTVRVVLRPRFADWRSFFGNVLPWHVLRGEDLTKVWTDGIDNPRTGTPIGSGPFLVEDWERGRQLVLRRNPNYWGPHGAYVERLVVRFGVDGNDLVEAFRHGAVDVAYNFPVGFLPGLRREPGLRIAATPGVAWDHFAIRLGPGGHPALDNRSPRNKLVRRALAMSIDRRALTRALFSEIQRGLAPSQSAVYLNRSRWYRPNWSSYRFDPTRARGLLERAGCARGSDGIYTCAGERLSIRFSSPVVPGGLRPRVLELVQPQLRQVGIELIPEFTPGVPFFAQVLPSGRFQVAIFSWASPGPSPFGKPVYGCGGELNFTGYCQRIVTADLDQAERILDDAQQARVMNRVDAQMARDVPVIPLYQIPVWAASSRALRGFSPSPSVLGLLGDVENWWLER
jgi:peptide/nickel transport system substrate-binding protein